jgi:hypothetical protein
VPSTRRMCGAGATGGSEVQVGVSRLSGWYADTAPPSRGKRSRDTCPPTAGRSGGATAPPRPQAAAKSAAAAPPSRAAEDVRENRRLRTPARG